MSPNSFESYYINQAGTGISGYSGLRYQKGHGFFGRLLSSAILPLIKYLGKKGLNTGIGIGRDLLQGDNIKDSMKKRIKSTGFEIADDALEKVKNIRQRGGGGRRRKKASKTDKSRRTASKLKLAALAKGRKRLATKRKNTVNKKRKNKIKSKVSLKSLFQ